MTSSATIGFIISYVLFFGILLLISPFFDADFGVRQSAFEIETTTANHLNIFWAFDLVNRFMAVGTAVSTNVFVSVLFWAMNIGLIVALVDLIWLG